MMVFILPACGVAQITPNINSGNPNFPFPQFKAYTGAPNTLANNNPEGVPHAELEQRIRDAYVILTNNMSYNINQNGTFAPLTVNGVRYIQPNSNNSTHCFCVEGDGYYLLAAAYMADKATFDGYYMWMHDRQFQKTVRYVDNVMNSPGYLYGDGISAAGSAGNSTNVFGGALTGDSPTDGDVDVGLALLVAWKQWGDAAQICVDPQVGAVTYKNEAIKYIKRMTDTVRITKSATVGDFNYASGDIGFDGYMKGGISWTETTNWASPAYLGMKLEFNGPQTNYVDYYAPAYFRSFADMLTAEGESAWCIKQYHRAEASGDWIVRQSYNQGNIAQAGRYSVTGTTAAFVPYDQASEDHRLAWRTILNYTWNGAPTRTWDPVTHQDVAGTNTYEYDAALRLAAFMKGPEKAPYNNDCMIYNTLSYGGPANVRWDYNMKGMAGDGFPINWRHGSASPAAVITGDVDLMSKMFRHCVISWDQVNSGAQLYLTSQPRYFHEWFRLLGMLTLTGNMHDPMDFAAAASQSNMKVYKAVDKTYAYVGDTITYTISYRNYSKQSATGVVITDVLPAGLGFISSSIPSSVTGSTVTWNIAGGVQGFVTGGLAATQGAFTMKVKVLPPATGRLCNVVTITTTNGTGWTSNEYPNNITDVMERNCVDILPARPLSLTKVVDKATVVAGDVVTYTITIKNNPVPFLNGGRPGVIVAAANDGVPASANSLYMKYRIYHGAHEAYINYQNYRVSYYLNKPGPPAWVLTATVNEGSATTPTQSQQTLIPGATWNHRFILRFPNQRATITPYLYYYNNNADKIHEGALVPQRLVSYIHDPSWLNWDWSNDWSAEAITAGDGHPYWPIANDWTNPLLPNQPVLKYYPDACSNNVTTTVKKQLVEEWDGYTWRRVFGNAPTTGRELENIVLKDVMPPELTFGGYVAGTPAGTIAGNTITWTVPLLRINETMTFEFWGTVKANTCTPPVPPTSLVNTVNATATNESLVSATATSSITCPPPLPVTLIYFKGNMQPSGALLTWATANEKNNHYFLLLKSYDAIHFDSLTTVNGNGSTASVSNYSFVDADVKAGIVYYKLIQVDYDGTKTPGSLISLQNDASSKLMVYPNPFTSEVHIKMMSLATAPISVKIISVTGNTVYSSDSHTTNEDILLGTDLASGVYFVQVTYGQDMQMVKLVKNR